MSEAPASLPATGANPAPRTIVQQAAALARSNAFVIILLSATFLVRVFWAVAIPAFQTPDEPQHFAYVQSLGENVTLTPNFYVSREIGVAESLTGLEAVPFHPAETQMFEADSLDGPKETELDNLPENLRTADETTRANSAKQYPPTYYLLASLVYRILSGFNVLIILLGVRILSAAISTATVFFSYLTLRRFFSEDRLAKASAFIIAMLPMYAYMGAAVNPDVLVWLGFSVFLYLLTRSFDEGLSPRMNVALGLTMATGALVKQTFLIAVPMYVILLAFLWYKKLLTPRQAATSLGVVLAMLVVLDGWVYLSGIVRTSPSYPGVHEHQARTIRSFLSHLYHRAGDYANTFNTAWGTYGWLDTPVSQRVFGLIRTVCAIATVGLVFYLVSTVVSRKPDLKAMFYVLISGVYVAAWVVLNYLRVTSGEAWLLQGRYFFPIIVPIIALLLRGLLFYVPLPRARDVVLVALVVGVLWFQVDSLAGYVIPRFYA
jgi:4-amino-4-deoxy-L-arabinose transferase-like glycosyltransferase